MADRRPSGCGDAFAAGVITGIVRGWDMPRTLSTPRRSALPRSARSATTDGVFDADEADAFIAERKLTDGGMGCGLTSRCPISSPQRAPIFWSSAGSSRRARGSSAASRCSRSKPTRRRRRSNWSATGTVLEILAAPDAKVAIGEVIARIEVERMSPPFDNGFGSSICSTG